MDRQLAGGGLADLEHVLDHHRQPVCLLVDDPGVVRRRALQGLLPQQLRVGEHGGQGRLQVVGHVGDQLHLHPLAAGLLRQGPVEARLDVVQLLRRLVQVRVRRQVQGRLQVPVPDGRHLVRQQADVPGQGGVFPQDPAEYGSWQQKRKECEPEEIVIGGDAQNTGQYQQPEGSWQADQDQRQTIPAAETALEGVFLSANGQRPQQTPPLVRLRVFPGDVPQPQGPHQRQQRRGIGGQQRQQPQNVRQRGPHPAVVPELKGREPATVG